MARAKRIEEEMVVIPMKPKKKRKKRTVLNSIEDKSDDSYKGLEGAQDRRLCKFGT